MLLFLHSCMVQCNGKWDPTDTLGSPKSQLRSQEFSFKLYLIKLDSQRKYNFNITWIFSERSLGNFKDLLNISELH